MGSVEAEGDLEEMRRRASRRAERRRKGGEKNQEGAEGLDRERKIGERCLRQERYSKERG